VNEPHQQTLAFDSATIGVADLEVAMRLWGDVFGLSVLISRDGAEDSLAAAWGLPGDAIRRQVVLGTPAGIGGRVHLVEFAEPGPAVREGARSTARCPKNVDLLCSDLPTRYEELKAKGFEFRSEPVEYPVDDLVVREVQMKGHDGLNVVLLELLGVDVSFTETGYAGLTTIVTVVPDPEAETRFWEEVFLLPLDSKHLLTGQTIETMVGLPKGAGLDARLFGQATDLLGRVETVHYQQIEGVDLFPRAVPPATGLLHLNFVGMDIDALQKRAAEFGSETAELGSRQTLVGSGRSIGVVAPSGFRVEVYERREEWIGSSKASR